VIVASDAAVAAEVMVAGRRDRVAGWLLTPYLVWSLFATALTVAIHDPTRAKKAPDPTGVVEVLAEGGA
jgi:tryptophan-rich sensory protein